MIPTSIVQDTLSRPLRSLRVSVTDRCNIRCQYCMPEEEYTWLPREDLLRFEETAQLVGYFTELGVDKVRLTGGEPLVRKDLAKLVELLRRNPRVRDLALTTNGILLDEQAESLFEAGLGRVTVSLDTLRADRFEALTRRRQLDRVLTGIGAAERVGFCGTKLDAVILRGTNEDELVDLIEFGKARGIEVRFIEYMDVGGATRWSLERVFSKDEMLRDLSSHYGPLEVVEEEAWAPACRYRLPDGTIFGIIASTTAPFCRTCDRSRLTADGLWLTCLYARGGVDLRKPLRGGASPESLRSLIRSVWSQRADRGAELRRETAFRTALVESESLRKDPHLEMHTRGG